MELTNKHFLFIICRFSSFHCLCRSYAFLNNLWIIFHSWIQHQCSEVLLIISYLRHLFTNHRLTLPFDNRSLTSPHILHTHNRFGELKLIMIVILLKSASKLRYVGCRRHNFNSVCDIILDVIILRTFLLMSILHPSIICSNCLKLLITIPILLIGCGGGLGHIDAAFGVNMLY